MPLLAAAMRRSASLWIVSFTIVGLVPSPGTVAVPGGFIGWPR
jgi:hypothetical protein